MTISQHLSIIRGLIQKYKVTKSFPRDVQLTDEYLYLLFNQAASLVNKRNIQKGHAISDWMYRPLFVTLSPANLNDCSAIGITCKAMKSDVKIPKPMMGRNKELLEVYSLDNKRFHRIALSDVKSYFLDSVLNATINYLIYDDYLYILQEDKPKKVKVHALWQDITELVDTCLNTDDCYNMDSDDYPLDDNNSYMVYDLVLQKLGIPLSMQGSNSK